ncbi:hypothetical protein BBJ29_001913 [Phytophthora kernoviae]|uniref:Enoyl reductase (ER) domain-containing protein n=1 Tax=Phytophthora kernoviae TaxID=325452 RepID=A0A421G214_9STRA|nr:hypothetical protein BBJ29_001913 [Phytophthora kernoviae]
MPSYRRIQVDTYSTDFRKATEIVEEPELPSPAPRNVVVKNHYLGINATDVNITNGGYGRTTLPVKCGLEAGEQQRQTLATNPPAGATGQFVVQLAKLAGNHVIGACSSDEKVEYLKSLGVDRPINYKKEDLNAVLKAEYPNGIDLAFEGVGGELFKSVLDNIAVFGRIIVFGNVSHYHGDSGPEPQYGYVQNRKMQLQSASLRGFQRCHYPKDEPVHLQRLQKLVQEGKLKATLDPTEYHGFESIPDALDRLYAQKNIGKLIIRL